MDNLIIPQEVLDLAFPAPHSLGVSAITDAVIATAQEKFILPVLGREMCEELAAGALPGLIGYVKPPLALYVKLLLLPVLASSAGQMGVVKYKGGTFSPAGEKSLAALERRTRADALILMRKAVAHIEDNIGDYPRYDPAKNVLRRVSTDGGVVL